MSSNIFSHALKSVKQNIQNQQASSLNQKSSSKINKNEQTSTQNLSILDRIKKKNSGSKNNKNFSDDEENGKNVSGVQKRIIKKGDTLMNVKKIITIKNKNDSSENYSDNNFKINIENQNEWKHDKFNGVPSASCNYTVFLRNTPQKLTLFNVKHYLSEQDQNLITGIRLQKNTAEINFSRLDAAHRAVQDLHGQIIKNCQIKASLVSEVNKPVSISTRLIKKNDKSQNNDEGQDDSNDEQKEEDEDDVSQKMQIDLPSNNQSIFSRIKKKK